MHIAFPSSLLRHIKALKQKRVDVVSEDLCDDILRRLGPSLRPYAGCTIIDVLPGCGLFSRKLHDLLNPRRHVLLEPEWELYSQFLQPLLDDPASKYHHRSWTDLDIWHPKKYIDDALLPVKEDPGHPTLHIVNATSHHTKSSTRGHGRTSYGVGSRFAKNVLTKQGFHSRGPTRMLMWCDDSDSAVLLPRQVHDRYKEAVVLESFCHVDEVAGFQKELKGATRQRRIDVASSRLANKRMEENLVDTPNHRRTQDIQVHGELPRPWHDEYIELERAHSAGTFPKDFTNPQYARLSSLRRNFKHEEKKLSVLSSLVKEQTAIDDLDLKRHSPNLNKDRTQAIVQQIAERTSTLKGNIAKLKVNSHSQYNFMADNDFAFRMIPGPLLMWDRRSYEPLIARTSEFLPQQKYSLLDFQEKPSEILSMTQEQYSYFFTLLTDLFLRGGSFNLGVLDLVAPGMYEAMRKAVPQLGDIREGGRWDIDSLRARIITPKMIWRLALAWDKWPFKAPFDAHREFQGFNFNKAIL